MWYKLIVILSITTFHGVVTQDTAYKSGLETLTNDEISAAALLKKMEQTQCLGIRTFDISETEETNRWHFQLIVPLKQLKEKNSFKMKFSKDVLWIVVNGSEYSYPGKYYFVHYEEPLFGREGLALIPFSVYYDKIYEDVPNIKEFKLNDQSFCIDGNDVGGTTRLDVPSSHISVPTFESPPPCLQLMDMIDVRGDWNATLRLPAESLKNKMDVTLEFDKELFNFQSNFGQFHTDDGKSYHLNNFNPEDFGNGPAEMKMNLFFNASNEFPSFKNVLINGKIFCLQHSTFNMFEPSFSSFVSNNNGPCIKFFEEFRNGNWNATLIPPVDMKNFTEIRMEFDKELMSLKTDGGDVITSDNKSYYIRFAEGKSPPDVKFFFEYYRNTEVPQLQVLLLDRMKKCVHLMTMSSSSSEFSETNLGTSQVRESVRMTKATTKKPTTITSTAKTTVRKTKAITTTTSLPPTKIAPLRTDSVPFQADTSTQSYFEIVSEKYMPAGSSEDVHKKDDECEGRKTQESAKRGELQITSNIPLTLSSQMSNNFNEQKASFTDVQESPEMGYYVNNIHLHLYFPINTQGNSEFAKGVRKFPRVPSEAVKNSGEHNTFYNYYGDSQYVTYTSPDRIGSEPILVVKPEPDNAGVKQMKPKADIPDAYIRGGVYGKSKARKQKSNEMLLPRLALFVRNSDN